MKIYLSIEEVIKKEYLDVDEIGNVKYFENLKKLMNFLQKQGHIIYRAPFAFSNDPDLYLQEELKLDRKPTFKEQMEIHMKWIDNSDVLLAEISVPSEGRSIIIQRALDKPLMGLPYTPIIFIKNKKFGRKFGRIMRGLIESKTVVYYEYDDIDEVINSWEQLIDKAFEMKC